MTELRRGRNFVHFIVIICTLLVAAFGSLFLPVSYMLGAQANILQVTSTSDSGAGSLREKLRTVSDGDIITFDSTVFPLGRPTTIFLQNPLPLISKTNVTIDGSANDVVLDGSQMSEKAAGLVITGINCRVFGLTIQRFHSDGLVLEKGSGGCQIGGSRAQNQTNYFAQNDENGINIKSNSNQVVGNNIGVNHSGDTALPNGKNGVVLIDGASDNTIGHTSEEQRNLISGNGENGVLIKGANTDNNRIIGNYIGVEIDGKIEIPNGIAGIAIHDQAKNNTIGGNAPNEGNFISGNSLSGIFFTDIGTSGNIVVSNFIGTNVDGTLDTFDHQLNGIIITDGASGNFIGNTMGAGSNVISGNHLSGIKIFGADTSLNEIRGNLIGSTKDGLGVLPNGLHGVEITGEAHDNVIGGSYTLGQGNLLSGNMNHGVVINGSAHDNRVLGNLIGPDITGNKSLGNHPFGGIDISNGAHDNDIGGLSNAEGNTISGNQTDGVAIFHEIAGEFTPRNQILGNRIGIALNGDNPLPNQGPGIFNGLGAQETKIEKNIIAYNKESGIFLPDCKNFNITQNQIYSNIEGGITYEIGNDTCSKPPQIRVTSVGVTETITGNYSISIPVQGVRIEFYSDDNDQGRFFEGSTQTDAAGRFTFTKNGGFSGNNITAIAIDGAGNTSQFSEPSRIEWTFLFYMNGDSDLHDFILDTIDNLKGSGESPRANVLALVDILTPTATLSGTVLYDLTSGVPIELNSSPAEKNMGDPQTLIDFVTMGRELYPSRHVLLSIVDHGGGWIPGGEESPWGSGILYRKRAWSGGSSGLSWDVTAEYDYLSSAEMRQAMAQITTNDNPLDVVFYDVCLMGMIEVAYELRDYASYFVSSQNIGWAPAGPQNRYIQTISDLPPNATPERVASLLVEAYAGSLPEQEHPFTLSAVDLSKLPGLVTAINGLADVLTPTLSSVDGAMQMHTAYSNTQKLDYDGDLMIEPATDGFVDIYDFALKVNNVYEVESIKSAAQRVISEVDSAIVAEIHKEGNPWLFPERTWDLGNVHGLSIFLPLGENLDLAVLVSDEISATTPISRNLSLRETYTITELQFVRDTNWDALIDQYYTILGDQVPMTVTDGPVTGLQEVDITPPESALTIEGEFEIGKNVTLTWSSQDLQSGIESISILHQNFGQEWKVIETPNKSSGQTTVVLASKCTNRFAVQATDKAANEEPMIYGKNVVEIDVAGCDRISLPFTAR